MFKSTEMKSTDVIDSTKLKAFASCPRRYMYEYEFGWRPLGKNIHLIFGTAWHEAMEHLLNNGYSPTSVADAYNKFLGEWRKDYSEYEDNVDAPKGPHNAFLALSEYAVTYRHDNFRTLYTEIAGTIPVTEEGDLMAFKIDGIIERDGKVYVMEHKTASRRGFEDSHKLGFQVGLYLHVLYALFGAKYKIGGLIINETIFYKPTSKDASRRVNEGSTVNSFERVPIDMTVGRMERWLENLQHYLEQLKTEKARLAAGDKGCFPMNFNACFNYNSKCPFFEFCLAWDNPLERRDEVPMDFEVSVWNPLEEYAEGVEKLQQIGLNSSNPEDEVGSTTPTNAIDDIAIDVKGASCE